MFLSICLIFAQIDKVEKTTESSVVLPFIKLDSIGTNPLNDTEKIIFKNTCANKLVQEFKPAPVYLVKYRENKEKRIEILYEQIGVASCIFKADNWISASVKLKIDVPKDHVLRARTVSAKNSIKDKILEVEQAGIVEFYLKPKETAVEFK
jgi:hypothetical protein